MQAIPDLKYQRIIGSGTFGKVKRAIYTPLARPVAVKILNKSKIQSKKDMSRVVRQIKILKELQHPNLLKLLYLGQTSKSYLLVTNLVQGQQLFQLINRKGNLSQQQARGYFVQLLDAVMYLHGKGIAHRDVKPENIIVEGKDKVWLIDYGLGNMFQEGQNLKTSCGSHCYAAPQMMNGKEYNPEKTQVWALGVTLYAMLSGNLPYEHSSPSILLQQMHTNDFPPITGITSALQELLKGMIEAKSSKRMSLKQIRQHRWVKTMQHEFTGEQADKQWNEEIVAKMQKQYGVVKRQEMIKMIKDEFQEQTISYYLQTMDQQQQSQTDGGQLQCHLGPVHLKYVFRTFEQAKHSLNTQYPHLQWISQATASTKQCIAQIKSIRGGFFYLVLQHK